MKTIWGMDIISFKLKGKRKPTGEKNKANQLSALRTSSKTGGKFSGYSTTKSFTSKETCVEGIDSSCLGLFPVLMGKKKFSKLDSFLLGVAWLKFL